MMGTYKIVGASGEAVAKRAFWLAWKACGGPVGMGFLQDRPEATEAEVWAGAREAYDYDGFGAKCSKDGEAHGDYVFGRMMKLDLRFGEDTIEHYDGEPRLDYQAWYLGFPTYADLLIAAAKELEAQLVTEGTRTDTPA